MSERARSSRMARRRPRLLLSSVFLGSALAGWSPAAESLPRSGPLAPGRPAESLEALEFDVSEEGPVEESEPDGVPPVDAREPDVLTFDELVVTPLGRETRAFESSLPVNVIGKDTFDERLPMGMGELFQGEPGLEASTTGPNSVRPVIRGLSDERVLILVDGIRLSEQRPGGNHVLSIDPAQIERVEVVRGPTSVMYGSDAIGGVMNIITRKGYESRAEGLRLGATQELQAESASEGWKSASHVKFGSGPVNGYVGGFYKLTQDLKTPKGELHESFYDGGTIWAGLNYIGESDWKVSGNYSFMEADVGIPAPEIFVKDRFEDERHHLFTGSFVKRKLSDVVDDLTVELGIQRHERHRVRQQKRFDAVGDPLADLLVDIFVDIDTYLLEPQTVLRLNEWNTVTCGVQGFIEVAASDRSIGAADGSVDNPFDGVPVIPDSSRVGIGVFAQDEIELSDRLTLTPGVRFDWIGSRAEGEPGHQITSTTSADDYAVTGNLGLLYKLTDGLNAYANAGRAFRAPTLLERFFFGPHDVGNDVGNPDLDPEFSWNFDAGLKLQLERVRGFAGGFYTRIEDYIVKVREGAGDDFLWQNIDDAELFGGELGADVILGHGLTAFGTVSYVRGRNLGSGDDLPEIPPLNGRLGLRYEHDLPRELGLWAELSSPWALRQDHPGPGERETAGWMLLDLRIGLCRKESWTLVLSAENILDKAYNNHLSRAWQAYPPETFGGATQAGRNVKIALQVDF